MKAKKYAIKNLILFLFHSRKPLKIKNEFDNLKVAKREKIAMAYTPKILAFAGSLREGSYNKKLVNIAIRGAKEAGAQVTVIDLKDYPLPIYDQDIEDKQGIPENAIKLKELMFQHDGFLLSCPEYNSSVSAALKNVIDWTSRKAKSEEVYLSCFIDKVVMLMSASPGNLGGLRCLVHVRSIFSNINSIVLPQQKSISQADQAFDSDGNLKDPKQQREVMELGKKLAEFLIKFKS